MTDPAPGARGGGAAECEHADRAVYRDWVWEHLPSASVRSARMKAYDDFTGQWPRWRDWFRAPLRRRLCEGGAGPGPAGPSMVMPYLTYLSLVCGVRLDYPVLLGRQFAGPFTVGVRPGGLGVDLDLFDRNVSRLAQLGYSDKGARGQLSWSFDRMLLHRGDPDLAALTLADLDGLRRGVEEFAELLRHDHVRDAFARPRAGRPNEDPAGSYFDTATVRVNAAHALLFNTGQIAVPTPGRAGRVDWAESVLPGEAPPKVRAVVERYVRLRLDADLDRPESIRHSRDALRRLVQ